MLRRIWNYLRTLFGMAAERAMDPAVEIEQAINEARRRDQELRNQAAKVIAHRTQIEAKIEGAAKDVGEARETAKQALLRAETAKNAGDTAGQTKWTNAAQSVALKLQAAESNLNSLREQYEIAITQADQAKSTVTQNAMRLQELAAKRMQLVGQLEQARMQEAVNRAVESISASMETNAPSLEKVEEKIQIQPLGGQGPGENCARPPPRAPSPNCARPCRWPRPMPGSRSSRRNWGLPRLASRRVVSGWRSPPTTPDVESEAAEPRAAAPAAAHHSRVLGGPRDPAARVRRDPARASRTRGRPAGVRQRPRLAPGGLLRHRPPASSPWPRSCSPQRSQIWMRGCSRRSDRVLEGADRPAEPGPAMQTLMRDRQAGLMHSMVYFGFLVLFAGTVTLEIDHILPNQFKFLEGSVYLGLLGDPRHGIPGLSRRAGLGSSSGGTCRDPGVCDPRPSRRTAVILGPADTDRGDRSDDRGGPDRTGRTARFRGLVVRGLSPLVCWSPTAPPPPLI